MVILHSPPDLAPATGYDRVTDVSFRDLVGPLPANDGLHGIFPYPARLLRQIPRYLLTDPWIMDGIDSVVDPFCGSGTVLLEAARLGLPSVGIEQNPIGALVSRVKGTPPDAEELAEALHLIDASKDRSSSHDYGSALERWFRPNDLDELSSMRRAIAKVTVGQDIRDGLLLVLALVTRQVAITDPRIPVPVRPHPDEVPRRSRPSVRASWAHQGRALVQSISADFHNGDAGRVKVIAGDARLSASWDETRGSGNNLILTSPPYGTAQKYLRSTSLEHAVLFGKDFKGVAHHERSSIGRERLRLKEAEAALEWTAPQAVEKWLSAIGEAQPSRETVYRAYFRDMSEMFTEAARPDIRCIRMVMIASTNTVGGVEIPTYKLLRSLAIERGWEFKASFRDAIRGRALLTRRNGEARPAGHEWIEVLERNG